MPPNEYEQERLENIRRNQEMLRTLNIPTLVDNATGELDRQRAQTAVVRKRRRDEKEKEAQSAPRVLRRSRRGKGLPTAEGKTEAVEVEVEVELPGRVEGPRPIKECRLEQGEEDTAGYVAFEATLKEMTKREEEAEEKEEEKGEGGHEGRSHETLGKVRVQFRPIKVVKTRILTMAIHPGSSREGTVIAAGDKEGRVGFLKYGSNDASSSTTSSSASEEKESSSSSMCVSAYKPFDSAVSGIKFVKASSKVFLSSYDGSVRCMDLNKEVFSECFVCEEEYSQHHFALDHTNQSTIYIGDSKGHLNIIDVRAPSANTTLIPLHSRKIGTVDQHPTNANVLATASNDRQACLWDVRKLAVHRGDKGATPLVALAHSRAASSAFFSPSGSTLLVTGMDDVVRLHALGTLADVMGKKGKKGAETKGLTFPCSTVRHNNQTGRWVTTFRAKWAPNSDAFAIGNMKRMVDCYSTSTAKSKTKGKTAPLAPSLFSIRDDLVTSIPSVVEWHPNPNTRATLATGNASGYVTVFGAG